MRMREFKQPVCESKSLAAATKNLTSALLDGYDASDRFFKNTNVRKTIHDKIQPALRIFCDEIKSDQSEYLKKNLEDLSCLAHFLLNKTRELELEKDIIENAQTIYDTLLFLKNEKKAGKSGLFVKR